jgi:hypothetical protein
LKQPREVSENLLQHLQHQDLVYAADAYSAIFLKAVAARLCSQIGSYSFCKLTKDFMLNSTFLDKETKLGLQQS